MTKRSVVAVCVFSIITFGIYAIYWMVKTKGEMVRLGADIPTAWLMIIPIANYYWQWKYGGGVEHVTRGKQSQGVAFILMLLVPWIAIPIFQSEFNKAADLGVVGLPQARVA
jgi:hypothetical protein